MQRLKSRPRRQLLAATLLVILPACHGGKAFRNSPRAAHIPGGEVLLPVEWSCDFAIVPVRINGGGPFNFLLDTGAARMVVTPQVAGQFPEDMFSHQISPRGADGRRVKVTHALNMPTLTLGQAQFSNVDAMIMNLDDVSDSLGLRLDGIIGCPLFRGLLLNINYPERIVRLEVGSLKEMKSENRFHYSGSSRPHVALEIEDTRYPFLVDSGSSSAISVSTRMLKTLEAQQEPVLVAVSVSVSGIPEPWNASRLVSDIKLGTHIIEQPIVRTGREPAIGSALLREFDLTYDFTHRLILLERPTAEPVTMPALRAAGVAFRKRGDHWLVWQLFPYLDADVEIREGDLATRINGTPVEAIDCATTREWLQHEEHISIDLLRNGRSFSVTLPVQELVP